ncbi:alpha/beta hydrolase-fold protein [soil metagenome]
MKLERDFPTTRISDADEAAFAAARSVAEPPPAEESAEQAGVPKGAVTQAHHVGKVAYPTVTRDYWVYVPSQYHAATPANLMVFQDGENYLKRTNAATVFDNLIAKGDLKPTIAVFIQPGDLDGQAKGSRGNRPFEYDSVTDTYVHFLLEELLPEAIGGYMVTDSPKGRAICGMSSGGICAFNAAWERPDRFGVVVSHVGSFTNIRGGHVYPSRVRQNSKRPIRVFLQDGTADLDNGYGNWPVANFDMAAALAWKGYDMRFEFGLGTHTYQHAAATLPQTLRWIFRA